MATAKRQPVAGVDYDADASMEQDDYEWFTSTGQYDGNGWAEEQERKEARKKWTDRAIELAEARHLTGTITRLGRWTGDDNSRWQSFRVPSSDRTGVYTVDWRDGAERPECHCTAASYGNPCCHAGAVIHAERQRVAALSAKRETFDSFRHNCGGY